jgi:hypothetical protein
MPTPSHSSWFDHPNKIWLAVQIIKLLIMYFSPLPCHLVPLRPKYSHHLFLTLSAYLKFNHSIVYITINKG